MPEQGPVSPVRSSLRSRRAEAVRLLGELYARAPGAARFEVQHLGESDQSVTAYAFAADGSTLGSCLLFAGLGDAEPAVARALRDDHDVCEQVDDWVEDVWQVAGGPDQAAPTHATHGPGDPGYDLTNGIWV